MTPHLKLSIFCLVLSSHCISAIAAPHLSRRSDTSVGSSTTYRNITTRADDIDTPYYFEQRVSHNSLSISGKFKQRYWVNTQHYKPSGPILLVIGGIEPAANAPTDPLSIIKVGRLVEMFAEGFAGACILLEHRYFGESLPSKDLSEKSLKRLTIEQSIEDLAYFAKNVKLPGSIGLVHPDTNAWILVGSGYAGTLANWAMLKHEKLFSAGYASSAPARAHEDLWTYWDSARKSMNKLSLVKCSGAIQFVAEHIDEVAKKNNKTEVAHLKKLLRLDGVTELVDVAEAVAYTVRLWDDIQPKENTQFHKFCATLDFQGLKDVDDILAGWGKWNEKVFKGENDDAFWGTHDKNHDRFTDKNPGRPWFWLQCNELGWFRTAAPKDSLIPQLLDVDNERRICSMHFPKTFKKPKPPRVKETNSQFKIARAKRMVATIGQYDAWAGSGLSFDNVSLDKESYKSLLVVDTGFISSDMLSLQNDDVFDSAQSHAYVILHKWLAEWKPKKSSSKWRAWLKKMEEKGSKLLKGGRA